MKGATLAASSRFIDVSNFNPRTHEGCDIEYIGT